MVETSRVSPPPREWLIHERPYPARPAPPAGNRPVRLYSLGFLDPVAGFTPSQPVACFFSKSLMLTLALLDDSEAPPYRYTVPDVLIGRDIACNCCLDDLTVSAQHARLSYHHGQWWVEDCNPGMAPS